jgi:peptide deformylase
MRAEVADHGAQRSRNEHADPVAEVRLGSFASILACRRHVRFWGNLGNADCPVISTEPASRTTITEIMTIRPIIRYPDPRLTLPAQPVTAFDGALRDLAGDLIETMHAAPGIGITAPHIGISLRVVVLDLDANDGARTYVNPEIIWASPETILHQEGSVSMPGVNDDIQRHARVRISYRDVAGNIQTEQSEGLRAVCHQHEIDQLNGLFWIQRLSRLKRERLIKRFEKVSRG